MTDEQGRPLTYWGGKPDEPHAGTVSLPWEKRVIESGTLVPNEPSTEQTSLSETQGTRDGIGPVCSPSAPAAEPTPRVDAALADIRARAWGDVGNDLGQMLKFARQLEREIADLKNDIKRHMDICSSLANENTDLRAKLAGLREQKPVAWIMPHLLQWLQQKNMGYRGVEVANVKVLSGPNAEVPLYADPFMSNESSAATGEREMNFDRVWDQIEHDLGFNEHNMRRDRPYNGQSHTCTGMRGSTEIRGVTFRDLRDCFIRALLSPSISQELYDEAAKGEAAVLCENDLYGCDLNQLDPMAVVQNLLCEVEKIMGIYPNVPALLETRQPEKGNE